MPTPTTQTAARPSEAPAAQEEGWSRIERLGERAAQDRAGALAELESLFRSGRPSEGIDGPTQGSLVTWALNPRFDRAVGTITGAWMPWAGKRFDAAGSRGDNLLARSARLPARLPWPTYSMRDAGERLAAFDFQTWIEPGALDPETDVLVIDYACVESNPRLLIKQVRDELVEIAPGAHLGKMLWRSGSGADASHTLLAFFALRSQLPA